MEIVLIRPTEFSEMIAILQIIKFIRYRQFRFDILQKLVLSDLFEKASPISQRLCLVERILFQAL